MQNPHTSSSLSKPPANGDVLVVSENDRTAEESPVLAVQALLLKSTLNALGVSSSAEKQPLGIPRQSIYTMPSELIQNIFDYLSPPEFSDARSTCRLWYLAGENRFVLAKMFKKAGWWSAMQKELQQLESLNLESGISMNESWFMSKRLTREMNLLRVSVLDAVQSHSNVYKQNADRPVGLTYKTDFFQLGSTSIQACSLKFFTSACGKFALIAEGCKIFVYELFGERLLPVTSILCPHKVLALSMDTSRGRYAIGALLSGRKGVMCDIELRPLPRGWQPCEMCGAEENDMYMMEGCHNHPKLCPYHMLQFHEGLDMNVQDWNQNADFHNCSTYTPVDIVNGSIDPQPRTIRYWPEVLVAFKRVGPRVPATGTLRCHPFEGLEASLNSNATFSHAHIRRTRHVRGGHCEKPPVIERLAPDSPIPVSPATLSLYHNICNEEDYPSSVAICPTRRCVAFGCGSGIELHWRDWHSGKNFVKWIPLTVPSDFLYFIPPRPTDKLSKLRLISSPAASQQRSMLGTYEYDVGIQSPGKNSSEGWRWLISHGHVRPSSCDEKSQALFYQAVPLSDGQNFIFTDPRYRCKVFLGHEYPFQRGIQLLHPVVAFIPPTQAIADGKTRETTPVRMYAVASDLTWGVRMVAVYGKSIVLYSVPSDLYQHICKTGTHCDHSTIAPEIINGVYIGRADHVVDVCIQAPPVVSRLDPSFAIWAFTRSGVALTYQFVPYAIGSSSSAKTDPSAVRTRIVQPDGRVIPVDQAQYDEYVAVGGTEDPMDLDIKLPYSGYDGAYDSYKAREEELTGSRWWMGTEVGDDKIMVDDTPWEVSVVQLTV